MENTAWLDDLGLPPRYGIITSNMSKSMNNMFEKARAGSWLQSIDSILVTIFKRIATIRRENTDWAGIIKKVVEQIKDWWDKCAGYEVYKINEGLGRFNVIHPKTKAWQKVNYWCQRAPMRVWSVAGTRHSLHRCIGVLSATPTIDDKLCLDRICGQALYIQKWKEPFQGIHTPGLYGDHQARWCNPPTKTIIN